MLLVTAVITLAPFRFSWPERFHLSWITNPADMGANVLLFLPLGFLYRLSAPAGRSRLGVWGAAAAASALLETAQIFLPGRYPSFVDVLTNSAGAVLVAMLHERVEHRLD